MVLRVSAMTNSGPDEEALFQHQQHWVAALLLQATEAVHGVLEVLPDPVHDGGSTTNQVRRREGFDCWCWSDRRVQMSQLWVFVSMCRSALVDGRSTCLPAYLQW